jgi:2,3-bisphosphoglycerate-dependent phosphoglycerate mutase
MQLYIVRHAQSSHNATLERLDQECDPPLTDLGKQQAEIVARYLAGGMKPGPSTWPCTEAPDGHLITQLYCSPMWRALQTAQPIGQVLGLTPEVWIDIHEQGGMYFDYGEVGGIVAQPGKTRQEILVEFPNYVLPEGITEQGWWTGGYEDRPTCHRRAIKVAEVLRQRAVSNERIAIVSHGTFIDALLKALLNQLAGHHFLYHHCNAGISRIDFSTDGHLDVRYLNLVAHLPPELTAC